MKICNKCKNKLLPNSEDGTGHQSFKLFISVDGDDYIDEKIIDLCNPCVNDVYEHITQSPEELEVEG